MKILTTPNSFLRKVAKPLKKVTSKDLQDIENMIFTLKAAHDPEGVGLAATQVGLDKRIFVLINERKPKIFVNPVVIEKSEKLLSHVYKKKKEQWLEGCLSIPKIWGFVDRPYQVTLKYQTIEYPFSKEPMLIDKQSVFKDVESAYVQHETDHLNGVLFTDHILKQNGQLYKEIDGELEPFSLT